MSLESGCRALISVHPSYLSRLPDQAQREVEFDRFWHDRKLVRRALQ